MSSSSGANSANGIGVNGKGLGSSSSGDGRTTDQIQSSNGKAGANVLTGNGAVNGRSDTSDVDRIPALTNGVVKTPHTDSLANRNKDVDMSGMGANTSSMLDLPPELFHLTSGYVSLGTLMERVSQQSFVDLTTLIDSMSQKIVLLPDTAGINGSSHSSMNGSSHAIVHNKNNVEKRSAWLDWAMTNREKFIKLMVISQWARANNESIQVLIDLKQWSDQQDQGFYDTAINIGQLKRDLFPFRLRNPDIKTALEVLATGKDSRMPDLGMLPLPPLTTEKMLRTLRNMNALLRIRLNLHEDLPWHLRQWKVGDGRATFSSPGEFEFDVTIADEDTSKQLYFVDLRFLFNPAPRLGDSRIRDALQFKSDEALLNAGVSGCFDFLRNFVLTHKITTLHTQSIDLARSTWTAALKVEMVHRWLIVQYWTNERYPKSWIEVGISSEVGRKKLLPGHTALPSIVSRWRRFGQLVEGEELDLRLENLQMEDILKRTIATHSIAVLKQTQRNLRDAAGTSSLLQMRVEESKDEPSDCKLHLRLGRTAPETTLCIEPITGRLCLQPTSETSGRAQHDLNNLKNPLQDAHRTLELFLCFDTLSRIGKQAMINGWEPIRNVRFTPDYLTSKFGLKIVQHAFFKPAWWANEAKNWMVAVTINLEGESWWAVEMYVSLGMVPEKLLTQLRFNGASSKTLSDVHNMNSVCNREDISFEAFRKIEQTSIRALTLSRTIRELGELPVSVGVHWLQQAIPDKFKIMWGQQRDDLEQVPTITILATQVVKSILDMPKPHPQNFQLFFGRYDENTGKVTALVRGNLPWTAQIADMISTTFDPSVSFSGKGNFTLQLEAPVGESFHVQMVERLNLLVRATAFLTTLKSHRITPTNSTVSRIRFNYPEPASDSTTSLSTDIKPEERAESSQPPSLACEVTFSPDASASPSIRFLPTSENPHNRISDALSELLAKKSAHNFLAVLNITLPLLRAIKRVELYGNIVRTWSFFKYRLVYRGASTVFEIVCKLVDGEAEWQVYETRAGGNQQPGNQRLQLARPQGYEEMMKDFFAREPPGIRSLKTMLVCNSESIERAIDELDKLVRERIATSPPTPPNVGPQGLSTAPAPGQPIPPAGRGIPPNAVAARQQAQLQAQQRMMQQQQLHPNRPPNRGPGPNSHIVVLD
jgi:mediator of RNA polymerase II transcription subunit 14